MSILFMPLIILWLILLAGLLFLQLKRRRIAFVCGFFSILWLAVISLPFIPNLLVRSLEKRYPPLLEISQFNLKDSVNILALGAGYTSNRDLPPNDQLSLNSLGRLTEAIRIHRLLNASFLILSGSEPGEKVSESELYLRTAIALGVKNSEIGFLGTPQNTQMEAIDYTKKFGTKNTLIIVTDAIHMPRAMYLFRKAGQNPIPAPTNHMVKSDRIIYLRDRGPSSFNIVKMDYAMHEIIGLAWAKIEIH
jgi:uncharacterized SAM-binding protein YcdF (DUF218 family)